MADFTEEELDKALGNEETSPADDIVDGLKDENKDEPAPENNPDETQPGTDDAQKPDDSKPDDTQKADESKADDTNPDQTPENEPEQNPAPATEELILGKFKTQDDLVKAYQNLEKRFGEKAQEIKQVEQVKSDDFDKAIRQKIAEENWKLVDRAFETITNPEHAKEAQYLLMQFKRSGDPALLEQARSYLDARVDRRLEVESMNVAAQITQQANAHRQEILLKPLSDELDRMAEEDPDFMNDEQNQNLMGMAIKLNPTNVDVRAVKKAIQDYSKTQYQKGYEAAKREFAKQAEKTAVPVKSTGHVEQPKAKKNYDDMSMAEQLEEEYKQISLG